MGVLQKYSSNQDCVALDKSASEEIMNGWCLTMPSLWWEDKSKWFVVLQFSPQTRRRARASLSDISSLRDIEGLSVRQLKEILARNFVNYSGCCEKWELVERVSRLYRETEENRKSCGYQLHWMPPLSTDYIIINHAIINIIFYLLAVENVSSAVTTGKMSLILCTSHGDATSCFW